jgi:hypothetical protein
MPCLALVVYEVKKLISNGLRNYLFSASNIANAITYLVFIISFAVKFYTMIRVTAEKMNLNSDQFWNKVNNLDSHDIPSQIQVFETFYWLNSGILIKKYSSFCSAFCCENIEIIFFRSFLLGFI